MSYPDGHFHTSIRNGRLQGRSVDMNVPSAWEQSGKGTREKKSCLSVHYFSEWNQGDSILKDINRCSLTWPAALGKHYIGSTFLLENHRLINTQEKFLKIPATSQWIWLCLMLVFLFLTFICLIFTLPSPKSRRSDLRGAPWRKECDRSPCLKYWLSVQFQGLQFCKDHLDLVVHGQSGNVSRFQKPALHPKTRAWAPLTAPSHFIHLCSR